MKINWFRITVVSVFSVILIMFLALNASSVQIEAKESSFKLSKSKYTLYVGNRMTMNLIKDGTENFQDNPEFWMNGGFFSTSDNNIVQIDYYGNLVCVGTGTATITVHYYDQSAKCTIKVKESKLKLSSYEETLYSHQEIVIKASGIKKTESYNLSFEHADPNWYENADEEELRADPPSAWWDDNGDFHITAGRKGDYRFCITAKNNKGQYYSKYFLLHTIDAGPARTEINVAIGGEVELEMIDADILKMVPIKTYSGSGNYDYTGDYDDMGEYLDNDEAIGDEFDSPIESDGAGGFTAKYEGTVIYEMTYEVEDGTILTTKISVKGYKTDYIPFNEYLWVGSSYTPQFEYKPYNSLVICSSSDEEILEVTDYGSIVPMKGGNVTLNVWIDGLEFKEEIKVIDLNITDNTVMTWPGQKFSFKITGLPKGTKVTYESSNENVATIDKKKGKMKAVGIGFAVITVSINGNAHDFSVNVGNEISVKAVLNAAAVVGKAQYSQDRRMEEGYYDCSSLTWRSYAKAGLKIKNDTNAPTAADLAKYLEECGFVLEYGGLSVSEMQPGDFLFYAGTSDNGRFMKINHVAMYYGTVYNGEYSYDANGEKGLTGSGILVEAGSRGVHFTPVGDYCSAVLIARWKYE